MDIIHNLLSQLTLAEKALLTAGDSLWSLPPVPRLGIPAMQVTDGPNGARGPLGAGVTSACFPCGTALAATWNEALIEQVGMALAHETRAKGASVLLAPTINIHRSPLNGRHFECFSEDPLLSGKAAAAYIRGLQSQGIAACVKHYVCNDSEYQRQALDIRVDERTLHEIYLVPFEFAVKEGKAWAVMAAYNRVNGVYAAESALLLQQILKEDWQFDGPVMSDWFGTRSTGRSFTGGLDLEMPGPGRMLGPGLAGKIENGELDPALLDDKVLRYLRLAHRTGVLASDGPGPAHADDRPATRALIRQAACQSFVLLRNEDNLLPFSGEQLQSLAVIGPNARLGKIMGGGSAFVNPHYIVHPLQALEERLGAEVGISHHQGCHNHRRTPLLEPETLGGANGEPGVWVEYFDNPDFAGEPIAQEERHTSELMWFGRLPDRVQPGFAARVTLRFTPSVTGPHEFGLTVAGLARLRYGREVVINNWEEYVPGDFYFGMGSAEKRYTTDLQQGETCTLTVEFTGGSDRPFGVARLGAVPPLPENAMELAAAAAREADVALVCVGLNEDWESEGYDRMHMDLPGAQNELVSAVAASNPNTIAVVNAGAPVTMPWIEDVAAVLYVWYPGQEFGNALADVLLGTANPAGRLPVTLPRRLRDTPSFINYPGENGYVQYGEGIFVGYRYYDHKDIAPLFPFGHGLSYTSFAYERLRISQEDGTPDIRVEMDITNTGLRVGDEVVQIYAGAVAPSTARAPRTLQGFRRISLKPGEQTAVEFRLSGRELAYYDVRTQGWKAEAGTYRIEIGASSRDIRLSGEIVLATDWYEKPPGGLATISLDTPLPLVLAQKRGALFAGLGEAAQMPQFMMILGFALEEGWSLNEIADYVPDILTPEKLAAIGTALETA